jgi:hypothetical protein
MLAYILAVDTEGKFVRDALCMLGRFVPFVLRLLPELNHCIG